MTTSAAGHATVTPFVPQSAQILDVAPMTDRERFFRLQLEHPLGHKPGQFVMVSKLGIGEAPISISCGPRDDAIVEMVIRNVGSLTKALHGLKVGDRMGIRGPFGSGFDLDALSNHDIIFICGGLGLVPLRSLIQPVLADTARFGTITIISGCRSPADELYRDELAAWSQRPGVNIVRLVDRTCHQPWNGAVGLVTDPIAELELEPDRTIAALCGPPVMYKFAVLELLARGLPPERIYVDLERRMKCGLGKCGHCQINHVYCCQEGPVFRFADLAALPEALT